MALSTSAELIMAFCIVLCALTVRIKRRLNGAGEFDAGSSVHRGRHPPFGTPKPEMRLGFVQLDWDFLHDEWNFGAHSRAFATYGFDGQLSADHFDPFFHANQAQAFGVYGRNGFLDEK